MVRPLASLPEASDDGPVTEPLDTATERVTSELRRAILKGEYAVGDKLPAERELAERFRVNRATVRSALARLESLKLVTIHHGSGCVVQDVRSKGGLELVVALATESREGADLAEIAEDLLALRRAIAKEVLQRLAKAPSPPDVRPIAAAIEAFDRLARADAGILELAAADLAVFRAIVQATGSVVFLLCLNPIADVLHGIPGLVEATYAEPWQNVVSYRLLLAWLAVRNPEMLPSIEQALEAHDRAIVKALAKKKRR